MTELSPSASVLLARRATSPHAPTTLILSCTTLPAIPPPLVRLSTAASTDTATIPPERPSAVAAITSFPATPPPSALLAKFALLDMLTLPLMQICLAAVPAQPALLPLELTASPLIRPLPAPLLAAHMVSASSLTPVLSFAPVRSVT
jgi:hypothetical protein